MTLSKSLIPRFLGRVDLISSPILNNKFLIHLDVTPKEEAKKAISMDITPTLLIRALAYVYLKNLSTLN